MNKNIFEEIYSKHKKQLKNLLAHNKKLLICFGAVPGSGKTHISKILENKYKGIRVNNDNIRQIIDKVIKNHTNLAKENKEEILEEYLFHLLKNYNSPNGLIILDSSIDRIYKEVSLVALDTGFDLFIIDIKIPKRTVMKRIHKRNKNGARDYFREMNRWYNEHKNFEDKVRVDITIKNDKKLNLSHLYSKLNSVLK